MVSARSMLRSAASAAILLALGACSLALDIGADKYVDPHVTCELGTCICTGGFEDCDEDGDNGCESDVSADPFNCGACGNVCSNGACNFGSCECAAGFVDCDGDPSTGCETVLASDPQNCGACGNVCGVGACSNGECQPVTITGLDEARSIATGGGYVYAARCSPPTVAKARADVEPISAQQAADFTPCATLVAVDGARVYFAADKQILSAPLDPSADPKPQSLSPNADVFASRFFAVTDAHLYFWNDDTTQKTQAFARVPLAGGTIEPVADAIVTALAVDAKHAYFADQSGLHIWGTSDAKPTDLDPSLHPTSLAMESGTLFYATSEGIGSISSSGNSMSSIVSSASVKAIAADATHIYWADGSDGSIRRIGRDGTALTTLAKGESFGATVVLALDDRAAYWIAGTKVRAVSR